VLIPLIPRIDCLEQFRAAGLVDTERVDPDKFIPVSGSFLALVPDLRIPSFLFSTRVLRVLICHFLLFTSVGEYRVF
jgi:hypothetical protein